jgi:hypothetical protein
MKRTWTCEEARNLISEYTLTNLSDEFTAILGPPSLRMGC